MKDRRSFLQQLGAGTMAWAASGLLLPEVTDPIQEHLGRISAWSLDDQVEDEDFWKLIRQAYTVSPSIINLNNGGVSPQPLVVQEAVERYNRLSNETPSYYMWRILDKGREPLRENMALMAGCDSEEIAFNRNASEALETIIFGIQLERGDEVVVCKQDYPNMKHAWMQREARDGIVLKWVDLDLPIEDDDTIINAYERLFTSRTKVLHVTHMINWTGQVLPARKLARMARKHNALVVVDAAHSFAHLDFKIPDLECDYMGTSLHKWMCAPFGSGLIYVKKERIKETYPLFAAPKWDEDNVRKFEHLGTRSFAIEQAIGQALIFHEMIGMPRKSERLFYLKNYWAERVIGMDKISLGTSLKKGYSGALALLKVEGWKPQDVSQVLFKDHGIHTVAIDFENIQGVRITPNVYTLKSELDKLVSAIEKISMC
jgi:selenocysteine lyase/cysteine desulfurase